MQRLIRCADLADRLSERVGRGVAWLCLAMIAVLLFEVTARYLFNSPTAWAHESTTMLYGTFCILAGAYTHRYHGHVRSEVIYNLFSTRGRALLDLITGSIGLLVFALFFNITLHFAWDSWLMGEHSSKSTWGPPVYPFKAMLPLAIGLLMLQSLAHGLRDLLVVLGVQRPATPGYAAEPVPIAEPSR